MKKEETIKRMMQRLRQWIDENETNTVEVPKAVFDTALDLESALLWVVEPCSWTPKTLLDDRLAELNP